MAKRGEDKDEVIVNVPLRRLMTGVPRTKRARAAIPRIKRFVLRHVDPKWLEATEGPSPMREHRVLIDDFLNETIWRRGREHIAGPEVWVKSRDGGKRRLARKTAVRYGSVLKVKVLFVENPVDGGEARLEIYLPGYEDVKQEREDRRKVVEGEEEEKGDAKEEGEGAEKGGEKEPAAEASKKPKAAPEKAEPKAAKPEDKKEPKVKDEKSTTKSAAAKGAKGPAGKAEPKKAAPKPKKEGGD